MAEMSPITGVPSFAPEPLQIVEDVQVWLSQAQAIVKLAGDCREPLTAEAALGAAEALIGTSMKQLEAVESLLVRKGGR